jgi:Holliday junction DNA helicase RuvA
VIGSLRGTVLERSPAGEVLVEVGGVGYRALVPSGALPSLVPDAAAFLFTHLHVRDDALVLYGFCTREERETFEVLIATTGVGPKLALAMLSVHSPSTLRRAVLDDDLAALTLVPGVGKRTAQRLMIELRARLEIPAFASGGDGATSSTRSELREALVGLGYGTEEIREALALMPADGPVEEMLREALSVISGDRRELVRQAPGGPGPGVAVSDRHE